MDKQMIFAMTPRAGMWNYRYLVPTGGDKWPQKELSRLADAAGKSDRGDEFLSVSQEVSQPSTGRVGSELLVVADSRIKTLRAKQDQAILGEVTRRLQTYQQELDKLMTSRDDWDSLAPRLIVELPELDQWQQELEEQFRGVAPLPEGPEFKRKSSERIVTSKKLGIAAFIGFALIGITVGWSHFSTGIKADKPRSHDQIYRRDSLTYEERQAAGKLADAIGVFHESRADEVLLKKVADKLSNDLFAASSPPSAQTNGAPNSGGSEDFEPSHRKRITETLRYYYQVVFNSGQMQDSWVELADDQGVLAKLWQLYDRNDGPTNSADRTLPFDRCGLVRDKGSEIVYALQKIDPNGLRDIIAQLHKLRQSFDNLDSKVRQNGINPHGDVYAKFFHHFGSRYNNEFEVKEELSKLKPKFYLESDVDQAKNLSQLLDAKATRELLSKEHSENKPKSASLDERLKVVAEAYDKESWLQHKEIDNKKRQHREMREVFERLEEFVKACHTHFLTLSKGKPAPADPMRQHVDP